LLVVGSAAAACNGASDRPVGRPDADGSGAVERADTERAAAIYASVIRQLVTKDHTFGRADPGFKAVYVLDGAVKGAENPLTKLKDRHPDQPFAPAVKERVTERLVDLPPTTFVARRSAVVVGDEAGASPGHVTNDGVLLTLGPIEGGGNEVHVGANLWINGLAGHWLTYVVELHGNKWRVMGTTGPVAIS
jgi:hypothetical protein